MSDLKAPWSVHADHQTSAGRFDVFSSEGHLVAVATTGERAALICAAPELLEALQEMVAIVKKHTYPQPDKPSSTWGRMEAAEAAIAKALGQ